MIIEAVILKVVFFTAMAAVIHYGMKWNAKRKGKK